MYEVRMRVSSQIGCYRGYLKRMSGSARIRYCLGLLMLVGLVPGCHSTNSANTDVLRIGAYSVVKEVLHDGAHPGIQGEMEESDGPGPGIRRVV